MFSVPGGTCGCAVDQKKVGARDCEFLPVPPGRSTSCLFLAGSSLLCVKWWTSVGPVLLQRASCDVSVDMCRAQSLCKAVVRPCERFSTQFWSKSPRLQLIEGLVKELCAPLVAVLYIWWLWRGGGGGCYGWVVSTVVFFWVGGGGCLLSCCLLANGRETLESAGRRCGVNKRCCYSESSTREIIQ